MQLLSGFVGTSGGFAGLVLPLSKCLVNQDSETDRVFLGEGIVKTPILSHTDLACNTSYHFVASRTVFPRVPPYLARDLLRLFAHLYDSVASIHMTENPGRHD